MKKAVLISVVIVIPVLGLILYGFMQNGLTSHHASINVHLPEDISSQERLVRYEKIVEAMKTWAAGADMSLVENPDEKGNLSSFTSNPNADVRTCYFKDKLSSGGSMPLQMMSSYDANGSLQIVRIMFSEGYSREPSERLKRISSDLHARLLEVNKETDYRIW
ncbi:MAG: hypothetical protein ACYTET_06995 [Planctomycetota bacterium]|jgi:hypothetical protein